MDMHSFFCRTAGKMQALFEDNIMFFIQTARFFVVHPEHVQVDPVHSQRGRKLSLP